MSRRWITAFAGMTLSAAALAHPLAPGLLELREVAPQRYDVTWRTTVARARTIDVTPSLPPACATIGATPATVDGNEALVARWTVQCDAAGLAGRAIAIAGLAAGGINVIVRVAPLEGPVVSALLGPERASFTVPAARSAGAVFGEYFELGARHLLTGYDHGLFLLGLVLLVASLRALVVTVTAFTLGHSVTLALATLGYIRLDPLVAELGIALSILAVGWAVAVGRRLHAPWRMAAVFGLLHGLGFAGALAQAGLPAGEVPLALLAFNLGIEAGQVVLVTLLAAALAVGRRWAPRIAALAPARAVAAYCIGALAALWCFERAWLLIG